MSLPATLPSCAVVIPAYNAALYLREAIGTVVASAPAGTQLVVVDDGSTDETPAILDELGREYPSMVVVRQRNQGVSSARNAGLARVTTAFVCFLDADDRAAPGGLAALQAALEQDPRAAGSFGSCRYIDSQGEAVALRPVSRKTRTVTLADVLQKNFIDTPGAVLFRTTAVRAAGGFNEALIKGEDWEFYTRVVSRGYFVCCDVQVVEYRIHGASALHSRPINIDDFEPALSAVYSRDPAALGLSRAMLRAYELRNRAALLHLTTLLGKGVPVQIKNIKLSLNNLLKSGFDGPVIISSLRSLISAAKRI